MKKSLYRAMSVGSAMAASLKVAAFTASAQIQNIEIDRPDGFAGDFSSLMNSVLSFVMVIAALLVFFYLIWGGIEWITSGGDKGQTEKARNKITAAVVGLIILAAAYAILTLALNFLGFDDLNQVFESADPLDTVS